MELYIRREISVGSTVAEEQWIRFPSDGNHELSLGRSIDCKVRLLSPQVSRNHALLKRSENGKYLIKDRGSLLGTHVNGTQISAGQWHVVNEGDQIEFGRPEDEEVLKSMKIDDRFLYLVKQASTAELDEKPPGPKSHRSAMLKRLPHSTSQQKILPKPKAGGETIHKGSCKSSPDKKSEVEQENKRLKLQLKEKEHALKEEIESRNQVLEKQKTLLSELEKDYRSKVEQIEELKSKSFVDSKIEQENQRLRLELEKKELALKEEVDSKRKKLEEEQQRISELLKKNSESKTEQDQEIHEREESEVVHENKRLKQELEKKEHALMEEIDARNKRLEEEQKKITEQLEQDYKTKLEQKEEELEMRIQLEKDIAIEECKANIEEIAKQSSTLDTVVDTMENELQCSICSELFIVSMTLNCAHTFCEFCIKQWRKVRNVCPVCRRAIKTVTRSYVLDNYINKVMESVSGERRDTRNKVIEDRKKLVEAEKKPPPRRPPQNRGRGRNNSNRSGVSQRTRGAVSLQLYQPPVVTTSSSVVVISDEELSGDDDDDSDESIDDYYDDGLNPFPYRPRIYDPNYRGRYNDSDYDEDDEELE